MSAGVFAEAIAIGNHSFELDSVGNVSTQPRSFLYAIHWDGHSSADIRYNVGDPGGMLASDGMSWAYLKDAEWISNVSGISHNIAAG